MLKTLLIALICLSSVATAQKKTTAIAPVLPEVPKPPEVIKPELPPAATVAVNLAKVWQNGDPLPTAGENGTVIYRYGAAMPPIVTALGRLTTIMLEAGERVQSQPVIGDTLRWDYQLLTAGEGPAARTSLVLKPKRPDLETDLVVATNKRSYQFQLVSREKEHLSVVEFSYPPSENWQAYQAEQIRLVQEHKENTVAELAGKPNYGYTVQPKYKTRPPFTPKAVYDDTHHTYLKMPPEAKDWETAVLQTAGPNGCEIVNYRVTGDTWVIDRLFTSAELVSGTGKQAQRVSIQRDRARAVTCVKPGKVETAVK